MANHTKSSQPNPPITELITITITMTTYPKKKIEEFPKQRIFLLQTLSLQEIFDLNVFVVSRNCDGYD